MGQTEAIVALLRDKDYAGAVERSRAALQKEPKDPQLWTLQGMALTSLGRPGDALAAFERALTISPGYMPALEGAAQLRYQAGSRKAVPLLHRALKVRPVVAVRREIHLLISPARDVVAPALEPTRRDDGTSG